MFKNLITYRVFTNSGQLQELSAASIGEAISPQQFHPCQPGQPRAVGWVPPRGEEHAALAEFFNGHVMMRLKSEAKIIPAATVKKRTEELIGAVERLNGRKPGKKERSQLKEQAILDLLPQAFTRESATNVWIDPAAGLLHIDAGSTKVADEVASLLARAIDGLAILPLHTRQSPSQIMSDWLLSGDPPAAFTVDRECELKSTDEMKSVVRYGRHPLDIEEVHTHISQGKRPTRLALTWMGRVSFVLTDAGTLKKLDFLDGVFEGQAAKDSGDEFDANAAITTGELSRMFVDLVDALGGMSSEGDA